MFNHVLMKVKDLVNLLENATYLSKTEKERWLERISLMSLEQLKKFAGVMLLIEDQKANLEKERTLVVGGVASMFSAINNAVIKKARKDAYKISEKFSSKEDIRKLESLFKKMDDE